MANPPEAGSSFRPAFLLLDALHRRALSAYYAFAREVDDIADDPTLSSEEKAARLKNWEYGIDRIFSGKAASRLEAELSWAIKEFSMDRRHFSLVLEGVATDLTKNSYASFQELECYMYGVASAVGLACLAIFRYDAPRAEQLAEKLGYAVQLTNILRDVAQDQAAGRTYIPAEDLARFGCGPQDLGGSQYHANFIELMKFEADRAERFYIQALTLADPARKRRLLPALAMGRLYRDLLAKIRRDGFRVKEKRIRLCGVQKAAAILRTCLDYIKI